MDNNKRIQKLLKYSLIKLNDDSSLAKRGLRDLGVWPKIQTLLKEIDTQFLTGNYQKCLDLCDEVLLSVPLNISSLPYKLYSLIQLEKYDEALACADQLSEVASDFEVSSFIKECRLIATKKKILSFLNLRKYAEAFTWLDKYYELGPDPELAIKEKELCVIAVCLEIYSYVINKQYSDALALINLMFALDSQGKVNMDGCLNVFNKLLETINKNNNKIFGTVPSEGSTETVDLKQERYNEGIQMFNKCLSEVDKKNRLAFLYWVLRGNCYWGLRDYENAAGDYYAALLLNPLYGVIYENLALSLFNIGRYEDAHDFIDSAIKYQSELDPREGVGMPLNCKAHFFELQGDMKNAIAQYKKTLIKYPNNEFAINKLKELS